MKSALAWVLAPWVAAVCSVRAADLHHYVFVERERERIHEAWFEQTAEFRGAQIKYTWRELEPARDAYDFGAVLADLGHLGSLGKELVLQLQDVSFSTHINNAPDYLLNDPEFGGGANLQYSIPDDDEERARPEGWVTRRWDPAVQRRYQSLLEHLAAAVDGRLALFVMPETAATFGWSGRLHPPGYTPATYRDAMITYMRLARAAFTRSPVMLYANFMPADGSEESPSPHLVALYEYARDHGIGMGGPDLLPWKWGQMHNSYPLLREISGLVPTAIAGQWNNYLHVNPRTKKQVTVEEMVAFARDYLGVERIFWCMQEPYFSRDVRPFLIQQTSATQDK